MEEEYIRLKFRQVEKILEDRYLVCDAGGHKAEKDNYCDFCYRHVKYRSASGTFRSQDLMLQRQIDRLEGLRKVIQEAETVQAKKVQIFKESL